MFELFTGPPRRAPHRGTVPLVLSTAAHVAVIGAVTAVPLLFASADLPEVPTMLAFVVTAPPPEPPPPPPSPKAVTPPTQRTDPATVSRPVPVQAPAAIVAEPAESAAIGEGGVPGGVAGGVPDGVVGGIVAGVVGGVVPTGIVAPPPPPPAPARRAPVRIGGGITTPALLHRVAPVYPPVAVAAQVHGVVILEAVVDRDGRVEHVRVLRSIPLLDAAAIAAVRQWRYSPLLLNGTPESFVLTVTVSFSLNT